MKSVSRDRLTRRSWRSGREKVGGLALGPSGRIGVYASGTKKIVEHIFKILLFKFLANFWSGGRSAGVGFY